ncbi:MAG: nucleoside monophosphate kinase, partial [Sciscionella sp.]
LSVSEDEIVHRLSGRRTCRRCGQVWHLEFDRPAVDGRCDTCGGELFQRDDDKPETIRRRLEVYAEQTAPLVDYYRSLGLLRTIPADGDVDEVTERAIAVLDEVAAAGSPGR